MKNQQLLACASLLLVVLTGCGEADTSPPNTEPDGYEEAGDPNVLRCADDDLVDDLAFAGPGWDPINNALIGPPQATYTTATTIFAFHRDARRAGFDALLDRVLDAAKDSPGLVGVQIARSEKCGYARTISVWNNEDDMMQFVLSGAHSDAMTRVREVGIDGRTISWQADASELPVSWPAARAKIVVTLP